MKKLTTLAILAISTTLFAADNCKDENLNGLNVDYYSDLEETGKFEKLYSGDSPAPIGFPNIFGDSDSPCRDVMVTFLKHIESKKVYAMYTTHDDYCDGGNTIGIMVDVKKYQDLDLKMEEAAVAEIGDSEFYCLEK